MTALRRILQNHYLRDMVVTVQSDFLQNLFFLNLSATSCGKVVFKLRSTKIRYPDNFKMEMEALSPREFVVICKHNKMT